MPHFTPENPLRIGTRQSPLAMAQAKMAAKALCKAHDLPADAMRLVPMISSGDKVQDRALAELGGKALWTKELDRALADGDIDLSVHSMKDVETLRPALFKIAAMLPRADVRDRLIGAASIAALPSQAKVGTASPRRTAQLLSIRPDVQIALIRGNVATRLARVKSGEFDATLLAAAGLDRLGEGQVGAAIALEEMLPAPSQGAVGIECLSNNTGLSDFITAIDDADTSACVWMERAFLEALSADCHSPIAAYARVSGGAIELNAQIFSSNGAHMLADSCAANTGDFGPPARLARSMLERAPDDIKKLFGG